MIRTPLLVSVLAGSLLFTSTGCNDSASTGTSPDVAHDLALIAKHFTSLSAPGTEGAAPEETATARSAVQDTFIWTYNADSTECTFYMADSEMVCTEWCKYMNMDGVPKKFSELIDSTFYNGDTCRYRGEFTINGTMGAMTFTGTGSSVNATWIINPDSDSMSSATSMTYDCNYTYTYPQDGFVMNMSNYRVEGIYTDETENMSFSTDLVFLNGKYSAHISASYSMSDTTITETTVFLEAPLYDASNTKVGSIELTYDMNVKLYDLEGNLISSGSSGM